MGTMDRVKNFLRTRCPRLHRFLKKLYYKLKRNNTSVIAIAAQPSMGTGATDRQKTIIENYFLGEKRVNKVLIIGRIKEGDSIATHTNAFLNSADYSAYDVFVFDETTHDLYLYKDRNTVEYVKNCFATEIDPNYFDLLIYLNVLDNCTASYPFEERVPAKAPFLSYAYPVFDGTIPPKKWVNILNQYFDAVITPCNNLKSIFERAGVVNPIFTLPIALDLNAYKVKSKLPHNRDRNVFGWIGTFEDRKNPLKLIKAFQEAFGDNDKVQLYMHTRYIDRSTPAGKKFDAICSKLSSNITISEGVKSDEEIINLMNDFDAYVYVSQGEGYSITPRQAMVCGLPLVISAIPTHRDITALKEEDGIYWVAAQKEIEAVQPSLNNQICGKMFDIDVIELTRVLQRVYKERGQNSSRVLIKRRQTEAERYDTSNMKYAYRQVLLPSAVRYSEEERICEDGLETSDQDLLEKYRYFLKNEKRTIVVCPAHDGGFCSVFNKWLSHLVYLPDNVILIPDWRIKKLKANVLNQTGKAEFTSFCYGTERDGNIFLKCFENPYKDLVPNELMNTSIMYQVADRVLDLTDFNAVNEPNLTYINSYKLYADETYFPEFRKKYHHYFKKYVKFVPELQKQIDEFEEKHLKGRFVITAHIRSAAQQSELLSNDKPTWELYEKKIREILRSESIDPDSDSWRLFIASDNIQSIEHFKNIFKNHVVYQDMRRLTEEDDQEYQRAARKAGKNIEGFGLQHRAAHDETKWTIQNAHEILFDVAIMAKGYYFIFVNSNIATMVSYLNPELKMIYCR